MHREDVTLLLRVQDDGLGFDSHWKTLQWIKKAGFNVNPHIARFDDIDAVAEQHGESIQEVLHEIGMERFTFSMTYLQEHTGLSRDSIAEAKHGLSHAGIIRWRGERSSLTFTNGKKRGDGKSIDILLPNLNFYAVVTPAKNDKVFIAFKEIPDGQAN